MIKSRLEQGSKKADVDNEDEIVYIEIAVASEGAGTAKGRLLKTVLSNNTSREQDGFGEESCTVDQRKNI